jgi:neopullulanase
VLHQDGTYPDPDRLITLIGSHDVRGFMGESGARIEGLKLAATFLFTMRGIPQWYYGDEIAMPGGEDPDNRRDFPGGWPGDRRNGFVRSERSPAEQEVFTHVRTLMHLRAAHEPLRRGRLVHLFSSNAVYV